MTARNKNSFTKAPFLRYRLLVPFCFVSLIRRMSKCFQDTLFDFLTAHEHSLMRCDYDWNLSRGLAC
jgi:hypothetical protein